MTLKKFWHYWDRFGIVAILAVIMIIFGPLNPRILSLSNLLTVLQRSSTTAIAAVGMTYAICAGGFDLSVGSILSLVSCVIAINLPVIGMWPAIALGMLTGCLCGVINGLIITKLNIQTFVATLATQLAFKGVALVYSGGRRIMLTQNREIKVFANTTIGIIPLQVILMLLIYLLAYLIYRRTRFGVYTRAVGSNEQAAKASGINRDRTLIIVFVLTGLTAAMAGLLQTSQLATGEAGLGNGFETDVIASAILGGTALSGGKGNLWGTLVGAILLTFIRNGLNILGMGEAPQNLAVAAVLLFALSVGGVKLITQEATA